jgi:hypothetical protein
MDADKLRELVGASLREAGFVGQASSWYRQTPETLLVVNLQRSSYGPLFYVNLACVPLGMEIKGMPRPKEHHCPIRIRLDAASPEDAIQINETFDLAYDVSDGERSKSVHRLISERAVPFLEKLSNGEGVRRAIATGMLQGGLVGVEAKRHLGLGAA